MIAAIFETFFSLWNIILALVTYSPGGVPVGPLFTVFWFVFAVVYLHGDPM